MRNAKHRFSIEPLFSDILIYERVKPLKLISPTTEDFEVYSTAYLKKESQETFATPLKRVKIPPKTEPRIRQTPYFVWTALVPVVEFYHWETFNGLGVGAYGSEPTLHASIYLEGEVYLKGHGDQKAYNKYVEHILGYKGAWSTAYDLEYNQRRVAYYVHAMRYLMFLREACKKEIQTSETASERKKLEEAAFNAGLGFLQCISN